MQSGNPYRLNLVGAFGFFGPGGASIEISSKKSIALIALLACAPGGRRTREFLREVLWESSEADKAKDSLRRELSNLRKALQTMGADHLIVIEMQRISLDIEIIEVDIFRAGLGLGRNVSATELEFLEGLDIPGCERFEEWLRDERSRIYDLIQTEHDQPSAAPPSPVAIFGGVVPSALDAVQGAAPSLPPKPSLAVVPFECPSDDLRDWLSDSISHHLEKQIGQFPQLFVASGNSARTLQDRGCTAVQICSELGVSYLLEGRIIQIGDRIRVMVGLVRGDHGEQVWADTIDGHSDDIWSLHERIAEQIAPRIWTMVDMSERDIGLRKLSPPQGHYEAYWRANALLRSWSPEAILEASEIADKLASENATCPWASSLAAYCHSVTYLMGYTHDPQAALRWASFYCQVAIRYGSDNVEALGYCAGTIINIGEDLDVADRLITQSLYILPAFQPTLFWGGWVDIFRGEPARAKDRFELALRINPASGARAQTLCGLGFASLLLDDPDSAMRFFSDSQIEDPEFPVTGFGKFAAEQLSGGPTDAGPPSSPSSIQAGLALLKLFRRDRDRERLMNAFGLDAAASTSDVQV